MMKTPASDNDNAFHLTRTTITQLRVVVPAGCERPVYFAADELARYLAALLSGSPPEIVVDPSAPPNVVVIGDGAGSERARVAARALTDDGYAIVIEPAGIAIGGANPRGVLFGVYALLHELGCRWLTPDDDGEMIPSLDVVRLATGTRVSTPDFRRRGLGEDTRAVPPDDAGWFTDLVADTRRLAGWMAKNRLSHLTTTAVALADDASLQDELARRGIVSSYGTGHTIPRLLPRELFAAHPDYFRMDEYGQRRADGNLCVSNRAAVAVVVSNAVEEVRSVGRPVELYSVQGEDTPSGSWCRCPDCVEMTPLEQNALLCRAVAAGLAAAGLAQTRVALAAYQSTLELAIDRSLLPDRVFVHFAPRERSYAEAIDAGDNIKFARQLAGWSGLLGDDSLGVIEYYTDAVRFGSLPVPLTRVIAADLRAYREAGATAWLRVLFMSRYSWWAYPLNLYVVARLAWDADEPVAAIVADFCRHRYGSAGRTMVAFFDRFEQATAPVVAGDLDNLTDTVDSLALLHEAIAFGERAIHEADDEVTTRRIRRDLLAARFAADLLRGEHRVAIDRLRHDPDAPHSAWLDSGLGIDQHTVK
jgi:hypothetical protein